MIRGRRTTLQRTSSGDIRVASAEGQWTQVTFDLPAASDQPEALDQPAAFEVPAAANGSDEP